MTGTIKEKAKNNKGLLPYEVIINAINGDSNSLAIVLHHYDKQINYLSIQYFQDDNGVIRQRVDPDIKYRLQTKLMDAVSRFKI